MPKEGTNLASLKYCWLAGEGERGREEKKESRRAAKAEGRDEQVRKLGITFC